MQFSSIITSLIAAAAAVTAAATPQQETSVGRRAVADVEASAKNQISAMEANGCNIFACMSGYAGSIGICAIALIEPTPAGEIACIAAIIQQGGNPPASCNGCL
ncbi:hypothetical protein NLU13_4698 [Sarocladium strictum]|uniref:Fungal calcium binding protein domain-containing protein n=1 Tax=Sarocladium strictum TaxID=5046 RepID=A0AA39GK61_SARSR|nr:hypothetical protein NLU13_4698 [Sarocladium strictum]